MATSIIDGTIEEAVLKWRKRLGSRFDRIVFRLADGSTKTWAKAVVMNNVADLIEPGVQGRFYLFTAMDHRGVHGVRTADGRAEFGMTKVNELAGLWVTIISVATIILYRTALDRGAPLLSVILVVLGIPMFLVYRHTRIEAERHFAADSGYSAPPAAVAGA